MDSVYTRTIIIFCLLVNCSPQGIRKLFPIKSYDTYFHKTGVPNSFLIIELPKLSVFNNIKNLDQNGSYNLLVGMKIPKDNKIYKRKGYYNLIPDYQSELYQTLTPFHKSITLKVKQGCNYFFLIPTGSYLYTIQYALPIKGLNFKRKIGGFKNKQISVEENDGYVKLTIDQLNYKKLIISKSDEPISDVSVKKMLNCEIL